MGISIGLTRLFYVLSEQGLISDELVTAPADVLVLPMTEDLGYAIGCATALREAGVRTQLHCEKKKFKAKLSYADKLGIPFAVFVGEDEIAAGEVSLKNLTTGEQVRCTTARAAEIIAAEVSRRNSGAIIKEG